MAVIGYYPMSGSTLATIGTNMVDAGSIWSRPWVIGGAVKFLNAGSWASTVTYTIPVNTDLSNYVNTYCIMSFLISLAPQSWDFTNFNLAGCTFSGTNYPIQSSLQTNNTWWLVFNWDRIIQSTHDVNVYHHVVMECIVITHWTGIQYFSVWAVYMYFDWVLTFTTSWASWSNVPYMTMSIALGDTDNQDQTIDDVIICTSPADLGTSYLERSLYYKWIL